MRFLDEWRWCTCNSRPSWSGANIVRGRIAWIMAWPMAAIFFTFSLPTSRHDKKVLIEFGMNSIAVSCDDRVSNKLYCVSFPGIFFISFLSKAAAAFNMASFFSSSVCWVAALLFTSAFFLQKLLRIFVVLECDDLCISICFFKHYLIPMEMFKICFFNLFATYGSTPCSFIILQRKVMETFSSSFCSRYSIAAKNAFRLSSSTFTGCTILRFKPPFVGILLLNLSVRKFMMHLLIVVD